MNAERLKLLPQAHAPGHPDVAGARLAARMNLPKTKSDEKRDVIAQGLAAQ